ncbi:hypothetical protein [Liquorilactobacillus vini]|nr:hypothetical protein [Liquorilactobacillus vini]
MLTISSLVNEAKIGPFRHDIVGSFLRTSKLKTTLAKHRAGEISDQKFL